ncbi:hypothetical protein TrCOL_g8493 [Triparma columacea]|uniref:isopentenyl-diphosphate Delta-isomerase n=2 Tax=Triparma columacea TaxID=722753 RepID=A0A9W7GAZ0_9STRA|nr:hypothetical protein TrCOL_g8493 [Triparma columacea]
MTQEDMMMKDMLIRTGNDDSIVGPASKFEAHTFSDETPRGAVHRAFSVFLFNSNNEMLITKRASTKITFPNVWTNACCSHPLYSQTPEEVDQNSPQDIASRSGKIESSGAKHAAIRKLDHELGVVPGSVPHSSFRFLTRFHYWASDTVTYGAEAPWGEHEIDYILFSRQQGDVPLTLNPEEVGEVMWVDQAKLRSMFEEKDLLWSPWFQGIMKLKGWEFWDNLDAIIEGKSEGCKDTEIHYFDPPEEFFARYNK